MIVFGLGHNTFLLHRMMSL